MVDGSATYRALAVDIAAHLLTTISTTPVVGYVSITGSITTTAVVFGVAVTVVTRRCSTTRTLTQRAGSTGVTTVATGVLG